MSKEYQIAVLGKAGTPAVIVEKEAGEENITVHTQADRAEPRTITPDDQNYWIIHKLALEVEKLSLQVQGD